MVSIACCGHPLAVIDVALVSSGVGSARGVVAFRIAGSMDGTRDWSKVSS